MALQAGGGNLLAAFKGPLKETAVVYMRRSYRNTVPGTVNLGAVVAGKKPD